MKSPFAFIHLIRIAAQLLEEQPDRTFLFDFIESCLRNKHEMVVYEAASAIVNMKNVSHKEIAPAVQTLQQFCGSSKVRFHHYFVLSNCELGFLGSTSICRCSQFEQSCNEASISSYCMQFGLGKFDN